MYNEGTAKEIVREHIQQTRVSLSHFKQKCPEFYYPAEEFFSTCVRIFGETDMCLLNISFDLPRQNVCERLTDIVRTVSQSHHLARWTIPLTCLLAEIKSVAVLPPEPTRRKLVMSTLTIKHRRKGAPMQHENNKGTLSVA